MNSASVTESIPHARRRAEEMAAATLRVHRQNCNLCATGKPCAEGMALSDQISGTPAAAAAIDGPPAISADARFIAGRIVIHMWIIFVAIPVVAVLVWSLMK
jgi:hypothetical protein